ncbi:MAG TPA: dual specificity protein phosphatase [Gemmataceae bacterium]|nr:dual specificity protein phosphatase [Gemmataceae bacterium]
MTHIEPSPLWLGHEGDARDFRRLFEIGIQAVVQLAVEVPPLQLPREMTYLRFPLYDGPGNDADLLALAINTLAALIRTGTPTLVCCAAGMQRTPTIAAAALSRVHGQSAQEWLERIARQHPTDVSPAFWNEVRARLAVDA